MPDVVFLVLFALSGLVVGSFLNVVIVRVPAGESLRTPPSRCPLCEAPIAKRDLVPVVSWVLLRGRCRSCGEPIPAGYPLVEAGNALLWLLAAVTLGPSWWVIIPFALLFSVLLALSVIDLELYILPNRITYPSILVSLVAIPVLSFILVDEPAGTIVWALIGGLGYAGLLAVTLIVWELIVHKEGMGMGDVKLALLLGLWLGWYHPMLPLVALIASSVLGLVVGLGILVVRRESRPFPFGPWLAIGAVLVLVFHGPILRFYGFDSDDEDAARLERRTASFEVAPGR
jgi:leader peptidase (prepilin peptidase) / N-methyltransferase